MNSSKATCSVALFAILMATTFGEALAEWKIVSYTVVPETDQDSFAVVRQPFSASCYGHTNSNGETAVGSAEAKAAIGTYSGPLVQVDVDVSSLGISLKQYKYIPEDNLPIGEIEYKGNAYANSKATIHGKADTTPFVLAMTTAKAGSETAIAKAEILHILGPITASKEEAEEGNCNLFNCPVLDFSLEKRAALILIASASCGKETSPTGAETVYQGGEAELDCSAWNIDEMVNLVSLATCP